MSRREDDEGEEEEKSAGDGGCGPPGALLLHLAMDEVDGDGRVEVDGVVPETLRCLVALAAAALEGLANSDLRPVAILGVILDPVDVLRGGNKLYLV